VADAVLEALLCPWRPDCWYKARQGVGTESSATMAASSWWSGSNPWSLKQM